MTSNLDTNYACVVFVASSTSGDFSVRAVTKFQRFNSVPNLFLSKLLVQVPDPLASANEYRCTASVAIQKARNGSVTET
jgi:hypothetical protein